MALSLPIMAGIYTLISLIGCDKLKVPFLFVIVHHLWIKKKQDLKIKQFDEWDAR